MVRLKIRKGDLVAILRGRDRGVRAKVLRVLPQDGRVVVEGVNMVLRHRRPRRAGEKGQRVHIPASLPISAVMIVCPSCKRRVKVGRKLSDEKLVRICRKCQTPL